MRTRSVHFMILIALLVCRPGWAEVSQKEVLSYFQAGNQAYKEGDYQKAVQEYQKIINSTKESGPVYYNLGNAYFKTGKLGFAILNYQKAKRFMPRDSDLKYNLRYAQSLVRKKNTNERNPGFLENLFHRYVNFFTLDELALLITILSLLCVIAHFLSIILKWKRWISLAVRWAILVLIFFHSAGLYDKLSSQTDMAIVVQDSNANFEPIETAPAHFELAEGMPVKIISLKDEWCKIKRDDGRLGWVKQAMLERIE